MIKDVKDPKGNNHSICIDDELSWLSPYITRAQSLGVPVWRIRKIMGYSVPKGKQERQWGATVKDANKKVTITLLKYVQQWRTRRDGKFEVQRWRDASKHYFEETLDVFAHELSHLLVWEHTADRYVAEKKLQASFARLAKQRGYRGY